MARKTKATSTEGAAKAFQNVLADPLPSPWPLTKRQRAVWDEILMRRGRDEWQPVDLRFAWELAQVIVSLHAEERRLLKEGMVLNDTERGPRLNPRAPIVQRLSRRAMWLGVYLRIHPASDAGHPHLVAGSRRAELEARAAVAPPVPPKRPTMDGRRRSRLLPQ